MKMKTIYKVTIIDETGTLTEEEKKDLEQQITKNLGGKENEKTN